MRQWSILRWTFTMACALQLVIVWHRMGWLFGAADFAALTGFYGYGVDDGTKL